jgi:hypothetical protein
MKEELNEIAVRLNKHKFRNSEKLLVPIPKVAEALDEAFEEGVKETNDKWKEAIQDALTNARRKANTQIKDEQSMAHTHTAINQIDDELKKMEAKE